jgi:hypothetical protein
MNEVQLHDIDRKEFEVIANYLENKHADLGKKKKDRLPDNPKQLLQMANTIRRALALDKKSSEALSVHVGSY